MRFALSISDDSGKLTIQTRWTGLSGIIALTALCALGPASEANGGNATITAGDPRNNGSLTLVIFCKRPNGTVEKIEKTVTGILASDDEGSKAVKIKAQLDDAGSDCWSTSSGSTNPFDIEPNDDDGNINDVEVTDDSTAEGMCIKVENFQAVSNARMSYEGSATVGTGMATVSVGSTSVSTTTSGKLPSKIMSELAAALHVAGVDAVFQRGGIHVRDNVSNVEVCIDNTDPGLTTGLSVFHRTANAVPVMGRSGVILFGLTLTLVLVALTGRRRDVWRRPNWL